MDEWRETTDGPLSRSMICPADDPEARVRKSCGVANRILSGQEKSFLPEYAYLLRKREATLAEFIIYGQEKQRDHLFVMREAIRQVKMCTTGKGSRGDVPLCYIQSS
jgi:hypothetical protein